MSKYKEIATVFTNLESLKAALADLKIEYQAGSVANDVELVAHWHQQAPRMVALAVQQSQAQAAGLGSFDGVGFRWNGKTFEAIRDNLDSGYDMFNRKFDQIKQRYAVHEVRRQAQLRGYAIKETVNTDGTVRVVLTSRR